MVYEVGAVEVLHDRGPLRNPRWTVGSGYLIGHRNLLTAAHNVDYRSAPGEGERLLIRRLGSHEYGAKVVLANGRDGPDLAIVEVTDSDFPEGEVPHVVFAEVDRSSTTPLTGCWTVGFLRYKEGSQTVVPHGGEYGSPRSSERPLRDTAQLRGDILPAANLVSGMLELQVTAAPAPPETGIGGSPWEGISGAVVFSAAQRQFRAVGVISEHHQPEGVSSLNVVPITSLNMLDAHTAARWWQRLGVTDPHGLVRLPSPRPLPSYRERINEIAGRTPVLYGREKWLDELAGFATGSEGYRWLEGGPSAGKTALAAHLVTGCPPTVDCVAYFLTRRLGDAHSGRFVTVVANQLAWLLGDDSPAPPDDPDALISLWRRAVEDAVRDDRHLLLVVDGLDEDLSGNVGRPSVAALIPGLIGEHAHVLVTSRCGFELPADVDLGGALRQIPRQELPDSLHATPGSDERPVVVSVVDDHPDLCRGVLARLPQASSSFIAGTQASTVAEFLALETAAVRRTDVVLLDVTLNDGTTPEQNVAKLKDNGHAVVIYTGEERPERLLGTLGIGADGLVRKEEAGCLEEALRAVMNGDECWVSPLMAAVVLKAGPKLSPIQVEILRPYVTGVAPQEIASMLGCSLEMVNSQLKIVKAHYKARGETAKTRTGLLRAALRHGDIPQDWYLRGR